MALLESELEFSTQEADLLQTATITEPNRFCHPRVLFPTRWKYIHLTSHWSTRLPHPRGTSWRWNREPQPTLLIYRYLEIQFGSKANRLQSISAVKE